MKAHKFLVLLYLALTATTLAQPTANDVFVRVVDTGPGLCCVVKMPGPHYMIYDAGYYMGDGEKACIDGIHELIPLHSEIELLVLSHSDSDHLGVVPEICDDYTVKRVLRSGYARTSGTWEDANNKIKAEKDNEGCLDINLGSVEFPPGATYRFGDTFVTMVSGFHEPPASWGSLDDGEEKNAGSIVIRLQYKGRSILFTGDAVGRHLNSDPGTCIATEKFMVDMSAVISIDSDVIIAPHHGGNNGSSEAFICRVSPEYVVFSAGHDNDHPSAGAAKRYLDCGVPLANMFRTDLGDDESDDGNWEWAYGRIPENTDKPRDDDVDILITQAGGLTVGYRHPH